MRRDWSVIPSKYKMGTSYQGEVVITFKQLCRVFDQPYRFNEPGLKIDAEWVLSSPSKKAVTIYNYKDGFNYCHKKGVSVEQINDWHIGGISRSVVIEVYKALGRDVLGLVLQDL